MKSVFPTPILVLILWLTTGSVLSYDQQSHVCEKRSKVSETIVRPCNKYVDLMGYKADFTEMSALCGENFANCTQNCTFKTYKKEKYCCDGWTGFEDGCLTPSCAPFTCQNGKCEHNEKTDESKCVCDNGWFGNNCSINEDQLSNNRRFCFKDKSCRKAFSSDELMTEEECCAKAKGKSWGNKENDCRSECPGSHSQIQQTYDIDFSTCTICPHEIRTFDGLFYKFHGQCIYTLVSYDVYDIQVQYNNCGGGSYMKCNLVMRILFGNHVLIVDGETATFDGNVVDMHKLASLDQATVIFNEMTGMVEVEISSGIKVKFSKKMVYLTVDKTLSPTEGLCGDNDGDASPEDEFVAKGELQKDAAAFANAHLVQQGSEICTADGYEPDNCKDASEAIQEEAKYACKKLNLPAFKRCPWSPYKEELMSACRNDYCAATTDEEKKEIICDKMAVYAYYCMYRGFPINYRTTDLCPRECKPGLVYKDSLSSCVTSCDNVFRKDRDNCQHEAGCYCPEGKVWDNEYNCVPIRDCKCKHNDQYYGYGDKTKMDCKTCQCFYGQWICPKRSCPKECKVISATHFKTFDKKYYSTETQTNCYYTLIETTDDELGHLKLVFQVEESMQHGPKNFKKLIVHFGYNTYVLDLSSVPISLVKNDQYNPFPFVDNSVEIKKTSEVSVSIHMFAVDIYLLPDLLQIKLDQVFKNKIIGMCGHMSHKKSDDYKLRSGIVADDLETFVEEFSGGCSPEEYYDACHYLTGQQIKTIVKKCEYLGNLLRDCKREDQEVDKYVRWCQTDLCRSLPKNSPLCSYMEHSAFSCSKMGFNLDWRDYGNVANMCGSYTSCPTNMKYTIRKDCNTYCHQLSHGPSDACDDNLRGPGCVCKDDMVMDNKGDCTHKSSCSCQDMEDNSVAYPPGHVLDLTCKKCTCESGKWSCEEKYGGHCSDEVVCPGETIFMKQTADYDVCEHVCGEKKDAECKKRKINGCYCPEGTYRTQKNKCVQKIGDCPCKFGKQEFDIGYEKTYPSSCKRFTCVRGDEIEPSKWKQHSTEKCSAICTVSGDYVKTFDEERYALQGSCPYIIFQDRHDSDNLEIVSQALSCSYASGRNCGQKITISFTIGSKKYRFKFIPLHGCVKILEENSEEKTICYSVYNTDYGLIIRPWYNILYIKDYGITIIYKQIRLGEYVLMIKVDNSIWASKTLGLCNDNDGSSDADGWLLRDSDTSTSDIQAFISSWKEDPNCANQPPINNYCSQYPDRASYASWACDKFFAANFLVECKSALSSSMQDQREYCVNKMCSCHEGGDDVCLCQALGFAAMECGFRHLPVYWRSSALCPIMCGYNEEYKAVADVCPNICPSLVEDPDKCKNEDMGSFEGCYCQEGYYRNEKLKCVPIQECPCKFNDDDGIPILIRSGDVYIDKNDKLNCKRRFCINGSLTVDYKHCHCGVDMKPCDDGKGCVLKKYVCDGTMDCEDGSDEDKEYCNEVCTSSTIQCGTSNQCIPPSSKCDGRKDCQNGWDEGNCDYGCSDKMFQCKNSTQCVSEDFVCDGHRDCNDGTDEEDCKNTTGTPVCDDESEMLCKNPQYDSTLCIPMNLRCDGHDDCGDAADEANCTVCEEEQLVYKNDGYKMWFDMWSNHFDEGIIGEGGEAVNDDDNSVVWFKVYPKGSDEHKPEIAKLYLEIIGVRKYKIISAGGISSGWVFVDGDGTATVYEGFPAGTKPQFIKVLLKRRGDNPIKVSNFQIWACSPPATTTAAPTTTTAAPSTVPTTAEPTTTEAICAHGPMTITNSPSGDYGYYATVMSEQDTTGTIDQILESFSWTSGSNYVEIKVKFFPVELYVQTVLIFLQGASTVQIIPYSDNFAYDEVNKDLVPSDVSNINLNINGDLASLTIKIWKASGFDSLTVYALKITVCRPEETTTVAATTTQGTTPAPATTTEELCPWVDRMGDIGVIFENLYCTGLKVDLDGLQHVENVSALALSYGSVFYYQANNEDGGLIKKAAEDAGMTTIILDQAEYRENLFLIICSSVSIPSPSSVYINGDENFPTEETQDSLAVMEDAKSITVQFSQKTLKLMLTAKNLASLSANMESEITTHGDIWFVKFESPTDTVTLTFYAADSPKPILIQNPMALTIERDVFYIYPYIGDIAGSTPVEINSLSWAIVFKPEIGYMAKVEQVTFMTMNVDEAKLIIDGVTYTVVPDPDGVVVFGFSPKIYTKVLKIILTKADEDLPLKIWYFLVSACFEPSQGTTPQSTTMTTTTEAPEECPYGEMAEEGFVYDSQYIKIAKYKAGSNDMVLLGNLGAKISIPADINLIKVFALVSPDDFIVVAALRNSWGVQKWRIKVKDSNGNLQNIGTWVDEDQPIYIRSYGYRVVVFVIKLNPNKDNRFVKLSLRACWQKRMVLLKCQLQHLH